MTGPLRLRPFTVKKGLPFVLKVHRRLPKIQGAMWSISVRLDAEVIGVALVGFPARMLNDDTLAVLRVAVIERADKLHKNACSMLYGACSRMAQASGVENLVTYTHVDESGISLKAAGWIDGGLTDGGEHNRPSRQRALAIDADQKRRWWAPWSIRARARDAEALADRKATQV